MSNGSAKNRPETSDGMYAMSVLGALTSIGMVVMGVIMLAAGDYPAASMGLFGLVKGLYTVAGAITLIIGFLVFASCIMLLRMKRRGANLMIIAQAIGVVISLLSFRVDILLIWLLGLVLPIIIIIYLLKTRHTLN